ncbi:MAG: hypothetical protein ACI86H_000803 [bacterium]|jgi:hypothetical protein
MRPEQNLENERQQARQRFLNRIRQEEKAKQRGKDDELSKRRSRQLAQDKSKTESQKNAEKEQNLLNQERERCRVKSNSREEAKLRAKSRVEKEGWEQINREWQGKQKAQSQDEQNFKNSFWSTFQEYLEKRSSSYQETEESYEQTVDQQQSLFQKLPIEIVTALQTFGFTTIPSFQEIKIIRKQFLQSCHPDKNNINKEVELVSLKKTQEINHAYDILKLYFQWS